MARIRYIKPGFFTNERLAELRPLARLLFIGLWCIADRAGRLEDRPKRIRAEILPFDNVSADKLLADLADSGFIIRYEAGGQRYIQVATFAKHQHPHMKEAESLIPAPDEHHASTSLAPDEPGGEWGVGNGQLATGNGERVTEVAAAASDPVLALLSKNFANGLGTLSVGV